MSEVLPSMEELLNRAYEQGRADERTLANTEVDVIKCSNGNLICPKCSSFQFDDVNDTPWYRTHIYCWSCGQKLKLKSDN